MKEYTTATIPPPKEATMVCPAALAANRHWLPVTPKVLPELKASHPLLIMGTISHLSRLSFDLQFYNSTECGIRSVPRFCQQFFFHDSHVFFIQET